MFAKQLPGGPEPVSVLTKTLMWGDLGRTKDTSSRDKNCRVSACTLYLSFLRISPAVFCLLCLPDKNRVHSSSISRGRRKWSCLPCRHPRPVGRAALAAAVALPFLAYLVFIIFISLDFFLFILCVESALPAFVSVRHMCAWSPWRPDEGGSPGSGIVDVC